MDEEQKTNKQIPTPQNPPPPAREASLPPFEIPPAPAQAIPEQTLPPQSVPVQSGQPSPQQPPNQTDIKIQPPSQKKGPGIGKILAVFLIIIILFLGGTSLTLAYTNYKIITPPKLVQRVIDKAILSTPLPKTPRLILRRTERKMASVKSANLETEIKFEADSPNFPVQNAKLKVLGPLEFKTPDQSKSQAEISGEIAMEGIQVSAAGEVRQIGDNIYFKLTEFPGGSFLPTGEIKDQWFVINIEKWREENKLPDYKQQTEEIVKILEDFIDNTYEWTNLEKTDEEDVYLLKIEPPISEINNLLFDLIETVEPEEQTELEKSLEKEDIEEFTKDIKSTQVNLKIGKKDSLIKEGSVSLLFDVEMPNFPFPASGQSTLAPITKTQITLTTTFRLSEYNKKVIIDVPQDAKDLTRYLKEYQTLLNEAQPELFQQPPSPSPVLGEKSYWNLLLLGELDQTL